MIDFVYALANPLVPYIRFALIAGILSSIPFGIIGSFVVVKRMSYIAGAISHAALGGIGAAIYFKEVFNISWINPLMGAFTAAVISGLIISAVIINGKERLDTVIGSIWAIGMSIGILFISKTPGYIDPMSYLFGNILFLGENELFIIVILNIVIILLSLLFYNQITAVSFDAEFAGLRGLKTSLFQILLILLISITVVLMVTIIGIVMVIALLTIPPAIASLFSKKLWHMMIISAVVCIILIITGLALSYILKLQTGSLTIIIAGILYLGSLFGVKLFKKGVKISGG
jgi:zinc transport system permease protein